MAAADLSLTNVLRHPLIMRGADPSQNRFARSTAFVLHHFSKTVLVHKMIKGCRIVQLTEVRNTSLMTIGCRVSRTAISDIAK